MRFGSEEVTGWIIDGITDPSDVDWRERLMGIVDQDTRGILRGNVDPQDLDDLVQDVKLTVLKNLQGYYRNLHNNEIGQRNSWLKTIVINTRTNYYRSRARMKADELDETLNISDQSFEREEQRAQNQAALYKAVQILAGIRTTPDRCLAFLLNRLSAIDRGHNGRTREIARDMENLPLGEVFHEVERQFAEQLNGELPGDMLQPIWEKIKPVANQPFQLSARMITDSSNWILKTLTTTYRKEE